MLVETTDIELETLTETLTAVSTIQDVQIRHSDIRTILFEVSTPTPEPHGAMAESGIVPLFPLHLENGWLVSELIASHDQLSAFREELDAAEIEYRITQVSATADVTSLLTERQRDVVDAALAHGYYDCPRGCTLTELAEALEVNKSVVSRILHRAEGRIITAYRSSSSQFAEYHPVGISECGL